MTVDNNDVNLNERWSCPVAAAAKHQYLTKFTQHSPIICKHTVLFCPILISVRL